MTGQRLSMAVTALSAGSATGALLLLDEPLSFWGGTAVDTGRITDVHHPQRGVSISATVLAMSSSRGSSSSSTVLAEQVRRGVGPSGILLRQRDAIVGLAAIVCHELYGIDLPVVVLSANDFDRLPRRAMSTVDARRGVVELITDAGHTGTEAK